MIFQLILGIALAAPPAALPPHAQSWWLAAQEHEEAGRLKKAQTGYRLVLRVDPDFAPATVALARVAVAKGELEHAKDLLSDHLYDLDAMLLLAQIHSQLHHYEEAADLYESLRNRDPVHSARYLILQSQALTQTDLDRSTSLFSRVLTFDLDEENKQLIANTAVSLCTSWMAANEEENAKKVLTSLEEKHPDLFIKGRLQQLKTRFQIESEARELALAAGIAPSTDLLRTLHQLRNKEELLKPQTFNRLMELTAEHPAVPEVWWLTARCALAQSRWQQALTATRTAESLDPSLAKYSFLTYTILTKGWEHQHPELRLQALTRAISRSGATEQMWLEKAALELTLGRTSQAQMSLAHTRPLTPKGERLRAAINQPLPPPPTIHGVSARPSSIAADSWLQLHRARAWAAHGDAGEEEAWDEALRAANQVVQWEPTFTDGWKLKGSLHQRLGQLDDAISSYEKVIALDPSQHDVAMVLVGLIDSEDRKAELLTKAANAKVPKAMLWQAKQEVGRYRYDIAYSLLTQTIRSSINDSTIRESQGLLEQIRMRVLLFSLLSALVLMALLSAPWVHFRAKTRGVTVAQWLEKSPHGYREVATIAATIRHDLLKHHLAILTSVANAMECGEEEKVQWAFERIYSKRGPIERFDELTSELTALARRDGVHLNLKHLDPIFAPIIAGFHKLKRMKSSFQRGDTRAAEQLRQIHEVTCLNGSFALAQLIKNTSLLKIDRPLIMSIYEGIDQQLQRDTQFVVLPGEEFWARMYRGDAENLIGNLLRNALQAAKEADNKVQVRFDIDEDFISGVQWIQIRIADNSNKKITTAMIRGRMVERGLGIAVELARRCSGSLTVEPEPGWSKAITFAVPRVEHPQTQAAFPGEPHV